MPTGQGLLKTKLGKTFLASFLAIDGQSGKLTSFQTISIEEDNNKKKGRLF